jgi:ribulose-phosphate 3-epimerase
MKYKLAASLICADFSNLSKDMGILNKNKIDQIHFDVMDGSFVPRFGLYPEILTITKSLIDIPMDVHLMIDKPEKYIDVFINAGLGRKDFIAFHFESTKHPDQVLRMIRNREIKSGIVLNISTPLNVLDYILDDIDMIMLMGINPGIVGHKLIPSVLQKIKDLKEKIGDKNIQIEIDGGVNFDSSKEMILNGADILVCGTQTIFNKNGLARNIVNLRKELNKI